MHSVTFNVDAVDINDHRLKANKHTENMFRDIISNENKNENIKFEAVSRPDKMFIGGLCHGFIETASTAFSKHYGLEICVDHIKLLVAQAFAIHVKLNSDKFRDKFVSGQDKKNLIVRRDDFVKGSNKNDWTIVFEKFAESIRENVLDKELITHLQKKTTISTIESTAAVNIALMDTFQNYFSYTLMTKCGIPFVKLCGSAEDWKNLRSLVEYLEKYDFKWYTDKLISVIDEFINASSGNHDLNFWKNFVKMIDQSGGQYYTGNITYFFPYFVKNGKYIRNDFANKFTAKDISMGISGAPFVWDYFGEKIPMKFHAGFVGFSQNGNTLCPEISWAVQECNGNTELKSATGCTLHGEDEDMKEDDESNITKPFIEDL